MCALNVFTRSWIAIFAGAESYKSWGEQCQTNLNRPVKGAGLRRSGRKLAPFGQRDSAVLLEGVAAVEVTVLIEVIVDRGVNGGELL